MARAGHSDFKTTQGYIDLADETFREEAELLEERPFGQKSGQKQRPRRRNRQQRASPRRCFSLQMSETGRRRSRTYPAWGYQTSPVLKVWRAWCTCPTKAASRHRSDTAGYA